MAPHVDVRRPCAAEPELFFPIDESLVIGHGVTTGEARALKICRTCAALASCRSRVLDAELPYGVVGGMTAVERRAARATRRSAAAA